ncbi:MAG: alpha/beta fold hydrolase [Flavobacteriales bacterium]|nr:alpha/beta fold hydrolase [Flavobacteriales bacterium]
MILNHRIQGEGEPLFILHGLFGSSDNWNTLGKRFAEHRQVILVDQRNHGRSFHTEEMNYSVMAEDLIRLMDHLTIERADMLGHSMGGKTVMKTALDHPERVERLIVADIGPQDYVSHHDEILDAMFSLDLDSLDSRSDAVARLSEKLGSPSVVQFLAKNLYWVEKGRLAWRMNLQVIADHLDEILSSVGQEVYSGETLFVRGTASDYIVDTDMMALHIQFPQSEVKSIEGAGHWLHAERPDEFFQIVTEFLGDSAM